MTKDEISQAIHDALGGKPEKTMSGNCARFAVALNKALGGEGEYVYVDGEHPEYVDHVLLKFEGAYYDGNGHVTVESIRTDWGRRPQSSGCDDDEILRMVDDADCWGPQIDVDDMAERIAEALPARAPSP